MDYRELYFKLFAVLADATELLEQNRPERAKEVLIEAQQEAEEQIVEEEAPRSKLIKFEPQI